MNPIKFLIGHLKGIYNGTDLDKAIDARYVVKNPRTAIKLLPRTKKGGMGVTKRPHEEPKYRRNMAAKSRRINRRTK